MSEQQQENNIDLEAIMLDLTTVKAWDNNVEHDVMTQEAANMIRGATDLITDEGKRNSVQALLGAMEAYCGFSDSYMTVALVERFLWKIHTKYGVKMKFSYIDVTEKEIMTGLSS